LQDWELLKDTDKKMKKKSRASDVVKFKFWLWFQLLSTLFCVILEMRNGLLKKNHLLLWEACSLDKRLQCSIFMLLFLTLACCFRWLSELCMCLAGLCFWWLLYRIYWFAFRMKLRGTINLFLVSFSVEIERRCWD
jgi:hypothetical protein